MIANILNVQGFIFQNFIFGDIMNVVEIFNSSVVGDQSVVANSSAGIVESAKNILDYFFKAIDVVSSVLDNNKDVIAKIKNEVYHIGDDVFSAESNVKNIVSDVKSGDYTKMLTDISGAFGFLEDAVNQLKSAAMDINNIADKIKGGMNNHQPVSM